MFSIIESQKVTLPKNRKELREKAELGLVNQSQSKPTTYTL